MKSLLGNRYFIITVVALAITVPLGMIEGLVSERQHYRDQVVRDIANSSTSTQKIVGPVLVAPCTRTWVTRETDTKRGIERQVEKTADCTRVFLPETLTIDGKVDTERRARGIYSALVYDSSLGFRASFSVPERAELERGKGEIRWGESYIAVGVADPRGVLNAPRLSLGGSELDFDAGPGLAVLGSGIRAMLPQGKDPFGREYDTRFDLQLRGMESLAFVPVGRQTDVALRSPWPHPSFSGRYLPRAHEIGADGFTATWRTSVFATDMARVFAQHGRNSSRTPVIDNNAFGVSFIDPVDLYTRADRAVKYGFLFVALTFVALVLTEVLQRLRIHPVQYAMVGVALAMFFLLVLSLAEHLGFATAYLVASVACVGLIWYYLRHVVQRRSLANAFGGGLLSLYGLLYGLLSSEDYALLMGSVLVFGVLALVMVLTRRVDWYAFGETARNQARAVSGGAGGEAGAETA